MHKVNTIHLGRLALIIFFLSITLIVFNAYVVGYSGNAYITLDQLCVLLIGFLIYAGSHIQYGHDSVLTLYAKEVLCFFSVLGLVALLTTAVQFTPFSPIDSHLLAFDDLSRLHMNRILAWTNDEPLFKKILITTYSTIDYQLVYIPLFLIVIKRFDVLYEFYFLLLLTALIGFIFYYFFPTMAPASVIDSPYFMASQKATGLKFEQIHHYLKPSTIEGGLIAMPSFHVIWAYLCLNSLRGWPLICWALFPINILLALSCVLLGWHYPIDLLGSVVVIIVAHLVLHRLGPG